MQYPLLEDGLNDLAVIRAMLETLNLFSETDSIRAEMQAIIADARGNFTRRLLELCDQMQAAPDTIKIDYEAFRVHALALMTRGYPGRSLNRFMKVDAFDEGESSLYCFEAAGLVDMEAVRRMPASQFVIMLLNAVLQSARNEAAYTSKATFDQNVFQKYITVLFLHYATIDPMFYGIHRDDYKN